MSTRDPRNNYYYVPLGIYDVINNLGSLAARFIFLPIEESFYIFFASTLYRGEPPERQRPDSIPLVANTLSMLIKLVLLVAMVILTFGYSFSYLALDIYGGDVLTEGGGATLLRWYCVYVLLLAVNGVTECFVFAAMSQQQVDRFCPITRSISSHLFCLQVQPSHVAVFPRVSDIITLPHPLLRKRWVHPG